MIHTLNIEVPFTADLKSQRVFDTSIYNSAFNTTNNILEVTPPGYDCPVILETNSYFNIILNTANLKIIKSDNNGNYPNLPDGIYKFRYSVDPNARVYIEKSYFRTSKIMAKLREVTNKLFSDKSKVGKELFLETLKSLNYAENLIKACTYIVDEEDFDALSATSLYNEAFNILNDLKQCEEC